MSSSLKSRVVDSILTNIQAGLLFLTSALRMWRSEGNMTRSSRAVVSAALGKGGRVTHSNQGPVITHEHPTNPVSVSGLHQIHCAFRWKWSSVRRRTVFLSLVRVRIHVESYFLFFCHCRVLPVNITEDTYILLLVIQEKYAHGFSFQNVLCCDKRDVNLHIRLSISSEMYWIVSESFDAEGYGLRGRDAVQSGISLPTFRKNVSNFPQKSL
jgi:hypothetical protein